MYAIIHLPTATLVSYSCPPPDGGQNTIKTLYFSKKSEAEYTLGLETFKTSPMTWQGVYMDQSGPSGSKQHTVPKHYLEIIEV